MNQGDGDFSTQKITPQLVSQIIDALRNKAYGSVEIYVENFSVTQITERTITKVHRTRFITKRQVKNTPNSNYYPREKNTDLPS